MKKACFIVMTITDCVNRNLIIKYKYFTIAITILFYVSQALSNCTLFAVSERTMPLSLIYSYYCDDSKNRQSKKVITSALSKKKREERFIQVTVRGNHT